MKRRRIIWITWFFIAAICGFGLSNIRIDNTLDAWVPSIAPLSKLKIFVFVGFESSDYDSKKVESELSELPTVSYCVGPSLSLPGFQNMTVSEDGTFHAVYCFAADGITDLQLINEVRSKLDQLSRNHSSTFSIGGPAVFHVTLNEASQWRMPLILGLIIVLGFLLLSLVTNSFYVGFVGMVALGLAQIILFGLAGWTGTIVDMSMLLVPALMLALGFSFTTHASLRAGSGNVLLLCGVTTLIGFASLSISSLPPVRSFALWASIGVVLVWLTVMSLVPKKSTCEVQKRNVVPCCFRYKYVIVTVAVFITITASILLGTLQVDTRPIHYFSDDSTLVQDYNRFEHRLMGMLPFEVSVTGVENFESILKSNVMIRNTFFIPSEIGSGIQSYWCMSNNESLEGLRTTFIDLQNIVDSEGGTLHIRGVAPQLHKLGDLMKSTAIYSIPTMILVTCIVVTWITRSLYIGLIASWMNIIPIAGIILIASIFELRLELPTLMIGAIAIGVGVDDTIHIVWAWKREGSINRAINCCLRSCLGSSLVASACLAVVIISPFGPTKQFGVLMTIALLLAIAADLLVLPLLLKQKVCSTRQLN